MRFRPQDATDKDIIEWLKADADLGGGGATTAALEREAAKRLEWYVLNKRADAAHDEQGAKK